MSKNTILIADDDENVREIIALYLKKEGYEVIHAGDGQETLQKVQTGKPALVLLDIMMPHIDGMEVCKRIRNTSKIPVIMLTAKGEELDRIIGLELGADDYITKPFSPREVAARVKAVLRRINDRDTFPADSIIFPGLEINMTEYYIKVDDEAVICTPKEIEIMWTLAGSPGRVFSREKLLEVVWGYDYFGDSRTVDTHIKRIRAKLESSSRKSHPWSIKTVWGVGYKFDIVPKETAGIS